MKKAIIRFGGDETVITAPAGKDMVFDGAVLQHGILSIGEYGSSGTKIAAFKVWDNAFFIDDGDEGYSITKPAW